MVNSMTGYGRCEIVTGSPESSESGNIIVEIKSVNHRFLEVGMRVTRDYSFIEDPIKKYISSRLNAGVFRRRHAATKGAAFGNRKL